MATSWTRRIVATIAAVAVIGGFAWAFRTKPIPVDITTVTEGPMLVTIRQEGITRVKDVFEVSTPIAGHLARTEIAAGDRVIGGKTVIAAIHPLDPPLIDTRTKAELEAARRAAEAALAIAMVEREQAGTNLDLAERALKRANQLAPSGVVAESQVEKAAGAVTLQQALVNAADAMIRLRRAELASAEARLTQPETGPRPSGSCCVTLTAPVDGVVLSVLARSEQPVAVGTRIAEIGDPSKLEVVVELISSDAVRIAPGTPAKITGWGGEAELDATVRRIEPTAVTKVSALGIEEQRVVAILDLAGSDARLGHGFRIVAEIAVWRSDKAVKVALPALFRVGNDWAVYVLKERRAVQTLVSVGRMNTSEAEILDGLTPGEPVIVHPSDQLEDGALAEPRAP